MGEDSDFEHFFAHEYRAVVGLAFVLCGRLDGAEDLAEDVFAAAYREWTRIGSYDDPAWVRRPTLVTDAAVNARPHSNDLALDVRDVPGQPLDEGALWLITPTQPPRKLAGHIVQGVG